MNTAVLHGLVGASADRRVMMGFAPAALLHALSFADVLDERTGRGYQRRFNARHSLDFRRYIQQPGSATIPLTFNLRPADDDSWQLVEESMGVLELRVRPGRRPLAQVDCQHRLGYLTDLSIPLPFMCFLGLTEREEMEIFGVINGKARGLSRSLLDFHDAQLCADLAVERPELLIALYLKNEPSSPWYNRLDLGGTPVSGLERRASLRTMQKAAKLFLRRLKPGRLATAEEAARTVHDFWVAMAAVAPHVFMRARTHLVTKGIGVYALMEVAADIVNEQQAGCRLDVDVFTAALGDFAMTFDWSSTGPLRGLGGESGVSSAVQIIREARLRAPLRVAHG
ncbi:DGQHR domain-containing protein [Inquilinus limosus]|uniref:DGQHR domain-containing protein n=1 Tax=Inquilinus limosus TaxID=171674 RepID=UPI003F16C1BC